MYKVIAVLASALFMSATSFSAPTLLPAKQVSAVDTNNTSDNLVIDNSPGSAADGTLQNIIDNLEVTTNVVNFTDHPNADIDRTDDITNAVRVTSTTNGTVTVNGQELEISYPWGVTSVVKGAAIAGGAIDIDEGELTIQFPEDAAGTGEGYIEGLVPTWASSTTLSVTPGSIIVGGTLVTKSSATAVGTFSFAGSSARDFHYVYISDAGAITASTTAPTEQTDGSGWYDGALRCIGAVREAYADSTLVEFTTTGRGLSYRSFYIYDATESRFFYDLLPTVDEFAQGFANSYSDVDGILPINCDLTWLELFTDRTTSGYNSAPDYIYVGTGWSGAVLTDDPSTGGAVFTIESHVDHVTIPLVVPFSTGTGKDLMVGSNSSVRNYDIGLYGHNVVR